MVEELNKKMEEVVDREILQYEKQTNLSDTQIEHIKTSLQNMFLLGALAEANLVSEFHKKGEIE